MNSNNKFLISIILFFFLLQCSGVCAGSDLKLCKDDIKKEYYIYDENYLLAPNSMHPRVSGSRTKRSVISIKDRAFRMIEKEKLEPRRGEGIAKAESLKELTGLLREGGAIGIFQPVCDSELQDIVKLVRFINHEALLLEAIKEIERSRRAGGKVLVRDICECAGLSNQQYREVLRDSYRLLRGIYRLIPAQKARSDKKLRKGRIDRETREKYEQLSEISETHHITLEFLMVHFDRPGNILYALYELCTYEQYREILDLNKIDLLEYEEEKLEAETRNLSVSVVQDATAEIVDHVHKMIAELRQQVKKGSKREDYLKEMNRLLKRGGIVDNSKLSSIRGNDTELVQIGRSVRFINHEALLLNAIEENRDIWLSQDRILIKNIYESTGLNYDQYREVLWKSYRLWREVNSLKPQKVPSVEDLERSVYERKLKQKFEELSKYSERHYVTLDYLMKHFECRGGILSALGSLQDYERYRGVLGLNKIDLVKYEEELLGVEPHHLLDFRIEDATANIIDRIHRMVDEMKLQTEAGSQEVGSLEKLDRLLREGGKVSGRVYPDDKNLQDVVKLVRFINHEALLLNAIRENESAWKAKGKVLVRDIYESAGLTYGQYKEVLNSSYRLRREVDRLVTLGIQKLREQVIRMRSERERKKYEQLSEDSRKYHITLDYLMEHFGCSGDILFALYWLSEYEQYREALGLNKIDLVYINVDPQPLVIDSSL